MVDERRVRRLNEIDYFGGTVIYWMQRDQRVHDNWALLYAKNLAESRRASLCVVFCLTDEPKAASGKYFRFMLEGLCEVDSELYELGIPFFLLSGDPAESIPKFVSNTNGKAVVADFSPLKYHQKWCDKLASKLRVSLSQVDAHNVVPVWQTSHKEEYAARTIRPKINKQLDFFLTDFPELGRQKFQWGGAVASIDWERVLSKYPHINHDFYKPGYSAGMKVLDDFKLQRMGCYKDFRNKPDKECQSGLSPYMNFGQISPQRVAFDIDGADRDDDVIEEFLEEQIVRRELTDNYCFYNDNYDSIEGADEWALKTLDEHRDDERDYIYSYEEFEGAKTHDHLWNAAQRELLVSGGMHGYMRMYWAKKILEWSVSPEDAFDTAIGLNDKHAIDGCDPNGFVGVAWAVCGVHDRAWRERPVFGKIRYMNYNGCKSKFKIDEYIKRVEMMG